MTAARARALTAAAPADRAAAEAGLGDAVARLLALSETYPDLRADRGFRQVASKLADTEARLAFGRDFASHRVASYHQRLETFPSALVARLFRFQRTAMFAVADAAARRVPDLDLGARS